MEKSQSSQSLYEQELFRLLGNPLSTDKPSKVNLESKVYVDFGAIASERREKIIERKKTQEQIEGILNEYPEDLLFWDIDKLKKEYNKDWQKIWRDYLATNIGEPQTRVIGQTRYSNGTMTLSTIIEQKPEQKPVEYSSDIKNGEYGYILKRRENVFIAHEIYHLLASAFQESKLGLLIKKQELETNNLNNGITAEMIVYAIQKFFDPSYGYGFNNSSESQKKRIKGNAETQAVYILVQTWLQDNVNIVEKKIMQQFVDIKSRQLESQLWIDKRIISVKIDGTNQYKPKVILTEPNPKDQFDVRLPKLPFIDKIIDKIQTAIFKVPTNEEITNILSSFIYSYEADTTEEEIRKTEQLAKTLALKIIHKLK